MNLKDLVDVVAGDDNNPLNKTTGRLVLDLVIKKIADALTSGEKVELPGLGKFEVKDRAERKGRNPATGEAITIPASKSVGFKVAKAVKSAL